MPTNRLTDAQCRAAKPQDRAFKMFDGHGLHLYVAASGAKVWRVAYRFAGKPKTISLGPYPEVALSEARDGAAKVRAALRDGQDPMQRRKAARRPGMTFADAADAYWQGRQDVSASYRDNATAAIQRYAKPVIGALPVAGLGKEDFLGCLNALNAAGKFAYVRKLRLWLSLVMDWCVEQGHAQGNPLASIKPDKAFGSRKVEHFAALPLSRVPELMQRLDLEDELLSVLACKLLALTWVRTSELRMMQWSEIEGDVWRIPAGRMKRAREHLVPLSRQALEIVGKLRQRKRSDAYVFPAEHRTDRPMSEGAILMLLARMGYRGQMTGHGWRSIASTWAHEHGFPSEAIEIQLAHAAENKVAAAYNRAAYMPVRRRMLQEFADWIVGG